MISAGIPIAILMVTPLVLKERIQAKAWIGAVVSIMGVVLLFQGKHSTDSYGSVLGDVDIVLSCLAWGLYTVLGENRWIR